MNFSADENVLFVYGTKLRVMSAKKSKCIGVESPYHIGWAYYSFEGNCLGLTAVFKKTIGEKSRLNNAI